MQKKIHFIVNPFSGVGQQRIIEKRIAALLDPEQFDPVVLYTEAAGHATSLAKTAVEQGVEIVVAVGGDGSVNEVMRGLIGSRTVLGIIPTGSGNGLAMHLKIGRKIDRALEILNMGTVRTIDTCTVNGAPFVNLAGVGFDAHVAYHMKRSKFRGLKGYLWQTLVHAWNFELPEVEITIDGKTFSRHCLVVEVANAPMFGYNFLMAPQAKLDDGLLDVVLIKKAPKWRYLISAWRFLNGTILKSRLTEHFEGRKIQISSKKQMAVHYDGEGFLTEEILQFEVVELSLRVMVPS